MLKEIAIKLFDLFVVNRNAIAVQSPDGKYHTRYERVTVDEVYRMLKKGGALGTYQQLYKNPCMKWICFDFDCRDKEKPDLNALYEACIQPMNIFLKENEIFYVNEFSGRRGIHIWILFDDYLHKATAYKVLKAILEKAGIHFDTTKYTLDEFPKTSVSKGNVLGLQVKIPLSVHQAGMQSFLFTEKYTKREYGSDFYKEQLDLLNNIQRNSKERILKKFNITEEPLHHSEEYQKYYVTGEDCWTLDEIKSILSETNVYKAIFERFEYGEPLPKDRYVLLGTLGKLPNGIHLMIELFSHAPNYSEETTLRQITNLRNKYYPATFRYLYCLYDMKMEDGLNPEWTALNYLLEKTDKNLELHSFTDNEKILLEDTSYTLKKEMNYLFVNDEVPVVSVYLEMKSLSAHDTQKMNEKLSRIENGEEISAEPELFYVFDRIEDHDRIRKMVTLGAYDRVLTTHAALKLFYNLYRSTKSFSYNPNYLSDNDIFFHWYQSWGNYIASIRKYIENPMYDDMCVLTMDLSHFYENIDFLTVYGLLKQYVDEKERNLLKWLISYNEKLTRRLNQDTRIGVPQGPAYARIIAEVFLGMILDLIGEQLEQKQEESFLLYRYVDDIIIFHDQSFDSQMLFQRLNNMLLENGLILNKEKSRIYGKIGDLTRQQKDEIIRANQFQYGLKKNDYSYLLEQEYVNRKINEIIGNKGGFKVSEISYYFSEYTNEAAKLYCFHQYANQIVKESVGRGSGYSCFYKYIMENFEVFQVFVKRKYDDAIPLNTLNFSCFVSALYYAAIKPDQTDNTQKLIDTCVRRLWTKLSDIQNEEDRTTISALKHFGGASS